MRILVAFYSRTGTTKKIALKLAEKLKADILEILCPSIGLGPVGYLKAGRSTMLKIFVPIQFSTKDRVLTNYSLVIIGTPIWAFTLSSPIKTFLTQNKKKFNKVAFFVTYHSSGVDKTFTDMAKIIDQKPIATLALTAPKVWQEKFEEKISCFIKTLSQFTLLR
ncbi:MAG: hypothetical protein ABH807_00695 [Candidatus Shapirobacteria bacterium]